MPVCTPPIRAVPMPRTPAPFDGPVPVKVGLGGASNVGNGWNGRIGSRYGCCS